MKATWMPEDAQGKKAVLLGVLFIALMVFKVTVGLPLPSPIIAVLAVAGLAYSLISIFLHKGRGILLVIPALVGLLVVAWIAAELMFPH